MTTKPGLSTRIVLGCAAAALLGLGAAWLAPAGSGGHASGGRALLALLALAIASLLGLLLARGIRRPIHRLTETALAWSRGDLRPRPEVNSRDELGVLAEALNRVAAAVERRDETARRHAEEQLIQTEKLATVGRLAAGVAHELNNPLGGVLLYANLLLESTGEDDPRHGNMRKIVLQATRAREIVRGLLTFARQSPPQAERTDLNAVVVDALSLLERHPQLQNVQVRTELSPLPLWIRADPPKMQQVLINILLNGAEAMRKGGVLTVRSGFSGRDGFCRVAVSDTGAGIPEENLGHIFEPFFTTKEVGQGIGLGLSISYGIVQQHGGEIEVQSTVGLGTTFRILLPLEREE